MIAIRLLAISVIIAFLSASMGYCEEAAGSHDETHHCIASCSAACCKSMVQDDRFVSPPSFEASEAFIPEQAFCHNLVVCNIEHPPKFSV